MKKLFMSLLLIPFLTACTTLQLHDAMTKAESAAWTAASALETVNTETGGILTTALVHYALKQTHNLGDETVVQAAAAEANKVIAVQVAAKAAGTSDRGLQSAATTVLSDPGVIQSVAARLPVAPVDSSPVPVNTGS